MRTHPANRRARPAKPNVRPPAEAAGLKWPAPAGLAVGGAWVLLLALAPPAHNAFWGVNALRSIAPVALAGAALAALAAALAAAFPPRGRVAGALAAVALAALVAFALRERFHLLGDTASRCGAIVDFARTARRVPLTQWASELHAQPLDLVTGLVLPAWIARATRNLELGVSVASFLLAIVYFAGAARVARRLAGGGAAAGLWLVLVAWGGIEAYAGYAESAGVALAAGIWWWDAMLAPLARRRDAARLALAWLAVVAAHRSGLLLAVPLAVRLFGPAAAGDTPGGRRDARLAAALAAACAVAFALAAGGGRLAQDARELLRAPDRDALASVPTDLVNLLALVAPLAVLGPVLAGAKALRRAAADPRAWAIAAAALVLLPTAYPVPVLASGLGIQRDWDLTLLLGLALTLAGAFTLAHLPAARLRGALVVALPVLALGTGGWLALNADERAVGARARALVAGPLPLGATHASAVLMTLGDRALLIGNPGAAASFLEASWRAVPSPARGLHAAGAWLQAGRPDDASRVLAAIRERGGLSAAAQAELEVLERRAGGAGVAP